MNEENFNFVKQAPVFVSQQVSNRYELYLNDPIESIDQFIDHLAVFANCTEDDLVILNVASPGGSVSVGEQYIMSMSKCAGMIIGVVGMGAASQGSAILMACDDLVITDMSTLLVHSFSYGNQNHASGMLNCATFNNKLNEKWLDKYFGEFLTPEERSDVLKGVDLQFDAEQIQERWDMIMEMRHGETEELIPDQVDNTEVKD